MSLLLNVRAAIRRQGSLGLSEAVRQAARRYLVECSDVTTLSSKAFPLVKSPTVHVWPIISLFLGVRAAS